MNDAGILYGHWVNFPDIWYILGHFGKCYGLLVYFPRFGILYNEESGNPVRVGTRVTRLAEFSPIGWLFTLVRFLEITEEATSLDYFFTQ
jgi:hypothetical protein